MLPTPSSFKLPLEKALAAARDALARGALGAASKHCLSLDPLVLSAEQATQVANLYTILSRAYRQQGRLLEAQALLEAAIHVDPNDEAVSQDLRDLLVAQRESTRGMGLQESAGRGSAVSVVSVKFEQIILDIATRHAIKHVCMLASSDQAFSQALHDHIPRVSQYALSFETETSKDAWSLSLGGLNEPSLFWMTVPPVARNQDTDAYLDVFKGYVDSVLNHPVKNHVLLVDTRLVSANLQEALRQQLKTVLRAREVLFYYRIECQGPFLIAYPSPLYVQHYLAAQEPHRRSAFSNPHGIVLPQLLEERFYDLALVVSYPGSGSHWLNTVMELYLDRPRLRSDRITFMPRDRTDYLWVHDHDLGLHMHHTDVLYLYRHPVDVLYSYTIAANHTIDEGFIRWHMRNLKQHLTKYLLSDERARLHLRYEALVADFDKAFHQVLRFFDHTYNADRLAWARGIVTKEALVKKGERTSHKRFIGKHLLAPEYQRLKRRFKERYQARIEDEVIAGELEPFFQPISS